jgi:hypothetical protein
LYVDVGAYDPIGFSNTLLLHRHGWRGLNIDANEASIGRFNIHRPEDRNVWAAVSDSSREVVYYSYPTPATNRILSPSDTATKNFLGEEPISATPLVTRRLNEILTETLQAKGQIGLLNIDCEHEDLTLIRHLDWERWQPLVVAVESHTEDTTQELTDHLSGKGYKLVGRLAVTLVFMKVEKSTRQRRVCQLKQEQLGTIAS